MASKDLNHVGVEYFRVTRWQDYFLIFTSMKIYAIAIKNVQK